MTGIHLIEREQWAEKPDVWQGEFQGGSYGADVSVMFYTTDKVGGGPKLPVIPIPRPSSSAPAARCLPSAIARSRQKPGRSSWRRPTCRTSSKTSDLGAWKPPTCM
ncbi:UNVERIFIED_ORG: hypothetical protein J2W85_004455 [Ensifer adhaerens]|nr:hypothetical protein [Ensifer adhaerens]